VRAVLRIGFDTKMTTKLLILGDSISLGVAEIRGINEIAARLDASYVDLLTPALAGTTIVIDADVHRTTGAVRDSVDGILATHSPDVVLIMLGGNDADMDWRRFVLSDGRIARSRVPVETYEKNLRLIAAKITATGAMPVLTDMPNHHFELRGPYVSKIAGKDISAMLERGGGQAASDKELVKYRDAVARVARDLNIPLARYGEVLDAQPPKEVIGIDGVHPSAAAHRLIAESLLPILIPLCAPAPAATCAATESTNNAR
jgi:lysophospholipase L1-like esterase